MNSTARPLFTGLLFTGLLVFSILFLSLALFFSNYTRPAHGQSVDIKTAPLKWSGDGLKLELQTMPLDLVRAFFLGRGFKKKEADFLATKGCIFRSSIGNSGTKTNAPPISIKLKEWIVFHKKKADPTSKTYLMLGTPRTREDWGKIWEQKNVPEQAKTAFYWALFPTEQTYRAGDYNWGMISFALPPQSRFDLEVYWQVAGTSKKHVFKNLECGK